MSQNNDIDEIHEYIEIANSFLNKFVQGGSLLGLHLKCQDESQFKRFVLEVNEVLSDAFGQHNIFSNNIFKAVNAPTMSGGPSYAAVQDVIGCLEAAATKLKRKEHQKDKGDKTYNRSFKPGDMTVEDITRLILAELVADFRTKGLDSRSLRDGYIGTTMSELEAKCANGQITVDFTLAMEQLEKEGYVGTGPMAGYDNPPDSSILILAMYSKREYVYLTEKGYREFQKRPATLGSSQPTVLISGGHFHQSTIGIGGNVNQTVSFTRQQDLEDLQRLIKVFETQMDDLGLDSVARKKAGVQISTIKAQLEDEPDPVIVAQAGRTLRNITEGTIASLIATATTTPGVWEWVNQVMSRLFC